MRKFSEWIASIKDPILKSRLIQNVPVAELDTGCFDINTMLTSFSWSQSKEGFDYWEHVYWQLSEKDTTALLVLT